MGRELGSGGSDHQAGIHRKPSDKISLISIYISYANEEMPVKYSQQLSEGEASGFARDPSWERSLLF